MTEFFNTDEPYHIARNMTGDDELASDLVAHVYLIMIERDDIRDPRSFFITTASKQFKLHNSEFNRLYRPNYTTEFNGDIHSLDSETVRSDKYLNHLNEYLERTPPTIEDWYIREVTLLWMNGMTYREIQKETKINSRYITEAIKQFKHDVLNSFHSNINLNDTDDIQTPEL